MTSLYPNDWQSYLGILLIFLRTMGLFLMVPGFSHNSIPGTVKILLALSMALLLHPIVKPYLIPISNSLSSLVVAAIRETLIGLVMGFSAYLTMEAIHLAAQFVGYQMGFGTAGLMDPQTQSNVSVMVHLQGWIALVLFFVCDMHHQVLQAFVASFSATKILENPFIFQGDCLKVLIAASGKIFALAIQLAAPFTILVLLCNVMIGILSRMMPQMNIIFFSFPLTLLLGLCTFYIIAPEMIDYFEVLLGDMSLNMMTLLKAL